MTKSIDKQIDEMEAGMFGDSTKAPGTDPPGTNPPGTDPPGTGAPGTEAPATEPPKTEPSPTEAPSTEAPGTTAPTTEAPEEDVDRYKRENEELRKRVDELSGPKTSAPKTSAPSTEAPLSEVDFVGDIDLEEIARDPKEFNKLLNKVYVQGVGTAKTLNKDALESLPSDIRKNVETVIALKEASEEFYGDNEDLRPFKKVVAAVFDDVVSEHPDWKYDKVLKESGIEARKRLELHRQVTKKDTKINPRLPKKKGQQKRSQQPTNADPLLTEIDDMNKVV